MESPPCVHSLMPFSLVPHSLKPCSTSNFSIMAEVALDTNLHYLIDRNECRDCGFGSGPSPRIPNRSANRLPRYRKIGADCEIWSEFCMSASRLNWIVEIIGDSGTRHSLEPCDVRRQSENWPNRRRRRRSCLVDRDRREILHSKSGIRRL